jgi:hypothetical protein
VRTNLSCHFYTLPSPPTFPRPGPIDLDMHSSVFLIMPKPSGLALPIAVPIGQRPCLPSTQVLDLDRPSYIQPALGVQRFAVRAPSGMHPLCETRRTQTFCCLSPAGCRLPSDDDIRDLDPSIVPAFPFLGLSVCFSRAFADGTRTSSTNPEASMWRFLSLCPPSVIRAKG